MTGENGRVDFLHQELQSLRQAMNEGFTNLGNKIDTERNRTEAGDKDFLRHCSEKRGGIYRRLKDQEEAMHSLETKTFRLFLIGNGIGFVLGVIVTTAVRAYFLGG